MEGKRAKHDTLGCEVEGTKFPGVFKTLIVLLTPVKAAQASEVIETGRIDPSLPVASDVFKSGADIKMSQTVADNQPCLSVGACE